jgi:hypothetical protein
VRNVRNMRNMLKTSGTPIQLPWRRARGRGDERTRD